MAFFFSFREKKKNDEQIEGKNVYSEGGEMEKRGIYQRRKEEKGGVGWLYVMFG